MPDTVLRTTGLTKSYGRTAAVADLDVTLRRGHIYGLIGRNGAGKTTLMRMVCGLVTPTSGSIEYFGDATGRDLRDNLRRLGCLIENPPLVGRMTARENLHLRRIIRGIPSAAVETDLLDLVGLADTGRKRASEFSLGMRQRLGIAAALVGGPELLLLDEPVNGLDPVGVVEIRELIRRLSTERGTTCLISSHNLPELFQTATDYLIVDRGELKKSVSLEDLERECRQFLLIRAGDPGALMRALDALGLRDVSVMPDGSIRVRDRVDDPSHLLRELTGHDLYPSTFAVQDQTLESYFLSVIGGSHA